MICKNCIHKDICKFSVVSIYECEHFADGTIKNQYDRIRNMSVEEMAEFMTCINNGWVTETGKEICKEKHLKYFESEVDTE